MRRTILLACLACSPITAYADDCAALKPRMQGLMDAVAPGDEKPWLAALDPRFTQIDETGAISNYKQTMDQIAPLPKGASGHIAVTEWACTSFGGTIVETHLIDEHEDFHGQKLHAFYRSTGTWLREKGDWKLIGLQSIALQQDPPAVELPAALMESYAGHYRAGPDYIVEITLKDGHLYSATNGGKAVEIKAEIADVLFTPGAPRTRRIFQRDAKGNVTGFLSRREERDIVFKKEK